MLGRRPQQIPSPQARCLPRPRPRGRPSEARRGAGDPAEDQAADGGGAGRASCRGRPIFLFFPDLLRTTKAASYLLNLLFLKQNNVLYLFVFACMCNRHGFRSFVTGKRCVVGD